MPDEPRHRVVIQLVLAAVHAGDPSRTQFVITEDNSLPRTVLGQGESIPGAAHRIFRELTNIDSGWVAVQQVAAVDEDGEVTIVYVACIPEIIALHGTGNQWVDFSALARHPKLLIRVGQAVGYHQTRGQP